MTLSDKYHLPVEAMRNREQYPDAAFHSHSHYEIYYFHGGSCTYLIGGRIWTLAPGDLILMHGMTLHSPKIDCRQPYDRTIVHFEPSFVSGMMRPPFTLNLLAPFQELGNTRLRLQGADKEHIEALLDTLCHLYQREDSLAYNRFLIVFLDLLHTIYELCADREPQIAEPAGVKEQNVQKIAAYIEANYMQDIHLDKLERELHLNRFYMTKIFKEVTGFTIFNFLYHRRINQAKILFLLDAGKTVTEACYETGFKHPSHFTRAFKAFAGMTPEAYKKTLPRQRP